MAMLAQEAQVDLEQVLAQKAELEQKAHVKVDSFPYVESNLPEHMKISADPRDAWTKPPPSNGNLKNAGVNTGEEHHDLGDVHVERGQVSPVHVSLQHNLASAGVNTGDDNLIHVDKGPEVYVPDSVPTATPRKTTGKLDKLGVNTGNKHTQWGDSLVSHEGLEASYNIGPSPNREFTSATPFPGTTNWAPKGSRAVKLASAHDFFKTSVKPLMLPNNRHAIATAKFEAKEPTGMAKLAAQPYIIEADAAKARAAEAESAWRATWSGRARLSGSPPKLVNRLSKLGWRLLKWRRLRKPLPKPNMSSQRRWPRLLSRCPTPRPRDRRQRR